MQKTVLAFGEALWDLLPAGPELGGAPLNIACRLHSLGDRSILVSRVGRDDHGKRALSRIAELGLDPSQVQWDDQHSTGTVEVTVDAHGDPSFRILPDAAYDFIEPRADLLELASAADLIYFGTLIQRSPVSRATLHRLLEQAAGRIVFLDLNLRRDCYSGETIIDSLRRADILKLNEREVKHVAELMAVPDGSVPDFCAAAIERWSLSCCLVTLGERGAFAAASDGRRTYAPGFAVDVVDTCGSGDAFSAGFVHAWLGGSTLADCCRLGCRLGAMVAAQKGATTPISNEQIEKFSMESHQLISDSTLLRFASG